MKSKKHTVFLMISLAVFTASVIVATICYCMAKSNIDSILSECSDTQFRVGLEESWFWSMFFTAGALGTELSFIRSVYKILKYKPNKWGRICYIISASLAVAAVAFYCLVFLNVLNFESANGGRVYTGGILFFALWPSFIVSFVLGSVPIGHIGTVVEDNSTTFDTTSD